MARYSIAELNALVAQVQAANSHDAALETRTAVERALFDALQSGASPAEIRTLTAAQQIAATHADAVRDGGYADEWGNWITITPR